MNTEQVIRDYLPEVIHLSLATVKDDKPWVCEVHFAYDDQLNLYYRSKATRRHSHEIATNPAVAGNIVKQYKADEAPVGVYFEGTAKLLQAGDEQDGAFEAIRSRFGDGIQILEEAKRSDGHQFYKITVDTYYVFGKFGNEGAHKYELKWDGGDKRHG